VASQDDKLTGREERDLPAGTHRDELEVVPAWRDPSTIPTKLFLEVALHDEQHRLHAEMGSPQDEQAPPVNERTLLWLELDSLIDKVKGEGERSLDPEEFCRYYLLLPMFQIGLVYVANVRQRARRRFKRSELSDHALDTAFHNACLFVMHPRESFDAEAALAAMPAAHRDALAAAEAAAAALPADASPALRAEVREKAAQAVLAAAGEETSGEKPADPDPAGPTDGS
jgi:hypothetical protein